MASPSILISGPVNTSKESLLRKIVNNLDNDFESVLSISTLQSRIIESSDLLPITASSEISPEDLTGIGIEITSWLDDTKEPRLVTLENLSTLLMYHDSETLFRFLHIVKSRLESDDTPLICIEDTTEDTPKVQPHMKLFDYIVFTRLSDGSLQYNVKKNSEDLPKLKM